MKNHPKSKNQNSQLSIQLFAILILIMSPIISFACGGYGSENITNSKIKNVTVFLSGAQIHRTGNFNIKKGITEVVFDNLSPFINTKSIQAKGKGDFTILEARHHVHHPLPSIVIQEGIPVHIKHKIKALEDSLQQTAFTADELRINKETLEMEKKILMSTQIYQGKGKASDSIPLLRDGLSFFREKLNDINAKMFVLKRKEHKNNKITAQMNDRLNQLR